MKNKITISDIDSWGACARKDGERYSDENLEKLLNGRKYITPREALNLEISDADKIWLILREDILGKKNYYEIGHIIARKAVKKHCLNCGIPDVEKWAREYMAMSMKDINVKSSRKALAAEAAKAAWAAWAKRAKRTAWAERAAWAAWAAWAERAAWAAWAARTARTAEAERAARTARTARTAEAAEREWQVDLLKKYF